MTYEAFWHPLTTLYPAGEAKAIALMVTELKYGLTLSDLLCGRLEQTDDAELMPIQQRLLAGEPVQYVIGTAEFGGRLFTVSPDVLIPRPETYELCQWALQSVADNGEARSCSPDDGSGSAVHQHPRFLDICTGSGCIACTLAAERPDAIVTGWDISGAALRVAAENAKRTGVNVKFELQDALALSPVPPRAKSFNLIISNPPYICENEKVTMERNVIDYEPDIALFVPDDDPLLFYRHIARYAAEALTTDGWLLFEINPLYADQLKAMLAATGYSHIDLRQDQFGKTRFIRACR